MKKEIRPEPSQVLADCQAGKQRFQFEIQPAYVNSLQEKGETSKDAIFSDILRNHYCNIHQLKYHIEIMMFAEQLQSASPQSCRVLREILPFSSEELLRRQFRMELELISARRATFQKMRIIQSQNK
jgi:hypothetical protein